jgi:hypothetical protein
MVETPARERLIVARHTNSRTSQIGEVPFWGRTRTLLIQRGCCNRLTSSNLKPFTRIRVTRCWSLLGLMLDFAVYCSHRCRTLPRVTSRSRSRKPMLSGPGGRCGLPAAAFEDLHHGIVGSIPSANGDRLQPDCARSLASCAPTRALFVSRARFARTLSPSLSALRRSSKNGVTLRPRTSCLSASDRALSSARS